MRIINSYDKTLQVLTGCEEEEIIVWGPITFRIYLLFFFASYPTIKKIFPPGILGFTVNGKKPKELTLLKDGDRVDFAVYFPSFISRNSLTDSNRKSVRDLN